MHSETGHPFSRARNVHPRNILLSWGTVHVAKASTLTSPTAVTFGTVKARLPELAIQQSSILHVPLLYYSHRDTLEEDPITPHATSIDSNESTLNDDI